MTNGLLAWYHHNARDLPWRRRNDPYAILVSEVLLQQTQVSRGIVYYERFLMAFPSVEDLAQAPLEAVLKAWEGAGYYARARNLQKAAQMVVELGAFPTNYRETLALAGVGPYTAAAVASIAFGEAVAVVDGNVRRVLARLFGEANPNAKWLQAKADLLLATALAQNPAATPGNWNQAIMELGATTCTPKAAACGRCPLALHCQALAQNQVSALPAPKAAPKSRTVAAVALIIGTNGRFYLEQRPQKGLLGGLLGVPLWEITEHDHEVALKQLGTRLGLGLDTLKPQLIGQVSHTMTHRQFEISVYWLASVPVLQDQLTDSKTAALARLDQKMLALLPLLFSN
jgi:A/G-specific adenine glycosylase